MMKIFDGKKERFLSGKPAFCLIFIILMAFSMGCQQKQMSNPVPGKTATVSTVTSKPEPSRDATMTSVPEKPKPSENPEKPGKSDKAGKTSKPSGRPSLNPYEPPPEATSAAPEGMLKAESLMLPLKTGFELQRASAQFLQCQSNEKNIGTALEMYYTDHGKFPASLSELSPEYLLTLPKCAASSKDSYSDSYVTNNDKTAYFFCCKGDYHRDMGAPANFPRYDSREGLLLPIGYEETLSPEMKLYRCESNLRTISNAIEMYSTDHRGKYPKKIDELVPGYLPKIPKCPAAGRDTYSSSYVLKTDNLSESYSLFCSGSHHTAMGLGKDYPAYIYLLGTVKQKPGLTEDDKKRIKQREAMKLLGEAMSASARNDRKKTREILDKVKKMNVLDDKFTGEQIEILEKKLERSEKHRR